MNAVEVSNLTLRFGEFTAVDHISFAVQQGEIFGFLGANGAGKTTTIRMLCGLLTPTEGEARVAGLDFRDGGRGIKTKVGYMSQRFTLYEDLTVDENLAFTASLRKLDPEFFRRREKELFEFIRFDFPGGMMVRDLPGGIRQELSLAAALLHDPEIVFLDEPTAGVAPAARARFWELIRRLSGEGKTIFVTTHYMDEAEECGRVALMRAGKIIALDSPAELKRTSFPEPMVEITPGRTPDPRWLEEARKLPAVLSVRPFGMRHHAVLRDLAEWERFAGTRPECFEWRRIQPSLEDVFVRLVEG